MPLFHAPIFESTVTNITKKLEAIGVNLNLAGKV